MCLAVTLALALVPHRTDGELGQGKAEGRKTSGKSTRWSSGRAGTLPWLTLGPQHPAQQRAERGCTGTVDDPVNA